MRFFNRFKNRGFTLVELMIVVAIIGVLAALAIYGVRRYLASAKTSEAKNTIGAISRGAVGAFEKGPTTQEVLVEGTSGTAQANDVCEAADQSVPTAMTGVQGVKYQANTADNQDFERGSNTSGWKCLRFTITSPIYFQYSYKAGTRGGADDLTVPTGFPGAATVVDPGFGAFAMGDLDGDSTFSGFAQTGVVNTGTSQLKLATELEVTDEYE